MTDRPTPMSYSNKSPEQIAGEVYSLTATALEKGEFGFEALAQHIPYALGRNKDKFVSWRKRSIPPEGKIVELDRFEDYLLLPVREGFGLPSLYFVDGMLKVMGKKGALALECLRIEIPDWDARVEKERMKQGVKEAPSEVGPGQGKRTDLSDEPSVNNTKLVRGSTNVEYLTARIKRDAPAIAKRLEDGEFKSVRAAAIEAGIVKPVSPVDQIKRLWGTLDRETEREILKWIEERKEERPQWAK